MSAEFVGKMSSAVDALSSGFSTFTGGTFTEEIWFGEAADNAKNQVSEKIDTKIEEVKSKLQNLSSALAKADEAKAAKERVAEMEEGIKSLDTTASDYNSKLKEWQTAKSEAQEKYDALIEEIKGLCS